MFVFKIHSELNVWSCTDGMSVSVLITSMYSSTRLF